MSLDKIKAKHLPLVEKVSEYSVEEEWTSDHLVFLFAQASIDYAVYSKFDSPCIKSFNHVDITNLLWITDTYYTDAIVAKALIEHRHNLGVL